MIFKKKMFDFYLCGPMTGYSEHNYPIFCKYAKKLREMGYSVWSPAEKNNVLDSFEFCMTKDLNIIINKCKRVAILPGEGWKKSVGSNAEINVAHVCGKFVYHIKETKKGIKLNKFKTKDKTPYYHKNITRKKFNEKYLCELI